MPGFGLIWFRAKSRGVAALTLPAFLSATLSPTLAAATEGQASPAPFEAPERNEIATAPSPVAGPFGAPPAQDPRVPQTGRDVAAQGALNAQALATPAFAGSGTPGPTGGGSPSGSPGTPAPGGGTVEISAGAISLPSGAATSYGMGESFTAQLTTGIGSYTIPFGMPRERGAAQASLSLVYASSGGFGVAGAGWSLAGTLFVARQTDRGVPRYDDRSDWHPEQDRFSFGGQELVPICTVSAGSCSGALAGEVMPVWADGWQYFRSRVEGGFLRFFWSPDHLTWRVQSKQGLDFELGVPLDGSGYDLALERNPDRPGEIFRWHLVRQYDSHGAPNAVPPAPVNIVQYRYFQDGGLAYLSDVFGTPPAAEPTDAPLADYAHHVRLRYELRSDTQTNYRSGWLLEQRLRLKGVDVTSKPFTDAAAPRSLVRRYHLSYDEALHTSLLTAVTLEGRCASTIEEDAEQTLPESSCPRLPPVTLSYARVQGGLPALSDRNGLRFEPLAASVRDVANSPERSIDSKNTGLLDINADGLPDVISTLPALYGGYHAVFFNRGVRNGALTFAAPERMGVAGVDGVDADVLSFQNPNVAPLDVDGDGRINLVHAPAVKKYSVFSAERAGSRWQWQGRSISTASRQNVKIDFARNAKRTAVMDVNGDGLVDVVVASATEYQTFFSLGRYPGGDAQFGQGRWTGPETAELSNEPVTSCTPWSAEPARLGDPDVRVADLNGDQLPDIVRIRSGQVHYWPGRGNGFWGNGERDTCRAGSFGQDRHLAMANPPRFGTAQAGMLALADVNADGFADLVEVRADAVDVYLNENGTGWTDRSTLTDVPIKPNESSAVQLVDLNGSGSADILWGRGHEYRYVDLTGGIRPYLLTKVESGLGRTTEIEYASSTDLMVRDELAGQPWASVMPLSATLVVRSTVLDNLDKVGRPLGRYVTEYSYRDPYFDGRQREFRGFRSAATRQLGDANSPSVTSRSVHLLGECEVSQNGFDVCAPANRWRDNWREALKGRPLYNEVFDDNGVYLSTAQTRYELRQLYAGRDGRRVSTVYAIGQEAFKYDTTDFDADETSVSLRSVDVRIDGVTQDETVPVPRRAAAGTVRVRHAATFDDFGNALTSTAFGCVEGCPTGDEAIVSTSEYERTAGDQSGWLWRPTRSFITGSVHTARRHESRVEYNTAGDALRLIATLSGTLPLDRFHETPGSAVAPPPPNASGGVSEPIDIVTMESTPDVFGTTVATRGALNRCRSVELDPDYAQLTVRETVFGGPAGPDGCGERQFVATASYDRGIGAVLEHTSTTGQPSRFEYDGFLRLVSETHADPDNPGTLAAAPQSVYEYHMPADARVTPYWVLVTRSQDGADRNSADYSEAYQYVDGLGRTIVALGEADPASGDGGQFLVGGQVTFDAKGAAARTYLNQFWSGDPLAYPLATAPAGLASGKRYDAFGREIVSYGLDGEPKLFTEYHALSADSWDAEDVRPGPHYGSYASVRADGHGRPVESIERVRVGTELQERKLLTEYLPTGEPRRVITRVAGTPDQVRWFRYDSLGRMVLNVEPNTSVGFNPNPDTNPSSIRALRYAYNDVSELVGTSDARGCGVNYHYDASGRMVGEDYSPCRAEHASYTAPDFATGTGVETLHRYDLPDPEAASAVDAAGNALPSNPSLLWGRLVSIADRGSKTLIAYDALGRSIGSAVRVVKPGPAASALAERYAPRWYVRTHAYDASDRPVLSSTGATSPELMGAGGLSVVSHVYGRRGQVKSASSSYGELLVSQKFDENGMLLERVLGDAARTTQSYGYDIQLRLRTAQTYRASPGIWTSPPAGYSAPVSNVSAQLLLEDTDYEYDQANNLTKITDYRLADEWSDSAKPVSRSFEYDDLYRLTRARYAYPSGSDSWSSPFAAENADPDARPRPAPHGAFTQRVLEQTFEYDHLGNTRRTTDDARGFFDRSLGTVTNGTANAGPHQLRSASNRAAPSPAAPGDLETSYDAAGNLTELVVRRDGECLPAAASCWQRFRYEWDEIGQLSRAQRYDLTGSERTANDSPSDPLPSRTADVDLRYAYDAIHGRVLKTAVDSNGIEQHTVYVFSSLELRNTSFEGSGSEADYTLNSSTETVTLVGGGVRARVLYSTAELPSLSSSGQHLFLELGDQLASTTAVIHHGTGELVEYATYLAYGQTESDYRPARWGEYRSPQKFSGKEEDIEVGLAYFGARYLSLGLNRWLSPDPATIHALRSDLNPYAYVKGRPLVSADPNGREIITAIVVGIVVGAIIAGGTNAAIQYANTGRVNWGWDNGGVLQAAAIGAISGAVTGGVGSLVTGGVAGAIGGSWGAVVGAVVGGAVSGAVGGAASYVAAAAFNDRLDRMSWKDFGSSVGMGAVYGGAFGAVNAVAVGLTEWQGAMGQATGSTRSGITFGGVVEGALVGGAQGTGAYFFLKWIGASDEVALIGAGAGAVNGVIAGTQGIYNWEHPTGYLAAGLDCTVGLVGTTLGNLMSIGNMIGGASLDWGLSYRQNRQVWVNGARLKGDHAFTLGGNVISNGGGHGNLINTHETLHLWQSRLFGPAWHATYLAWGVGGAVGGGTVGLFAGENVFTAAEAGGYTSNPFEFFAYTNQGIWSGYTNRYPGHYGVVYP